MPPTPLFSLPAVEAAVGEKIPVLFDSGIRRGSDILIARALGADFVFVGRATLYELNRPMTTHAHREGHLIFYVGRGHAEVPVSGKPLTTQPSPV